MAILMVLSGMALQAGGATSRDVVSTSQATGARVSTTNASMTGMHFQDKRMLATLGMIAVVTAAAIYSDCIAQTKKTTKKRI